VSEGAPHLEECPWLTPASQAWVALLLLSHRQAFGRPLWAGAESGRDGRQSAQEIFTASATVLAHDGGADPCFIYANRAALTLWRRRWHGMVGMPSRLSAAPEARGERKAALQRAQQAAIVDDSGERIDSNGRRFRIDSARLWTIHDADGKPCAQAATFDRWWWL
jgi:hypothetical protein